LHHTISRTRAAAAPPSVIGGPGSDRLQGLNARRQEVPVAVDNLVYLLQQSGCFFVGRFELHSLAGSQVVRLTNEENPFPPLLMSGPETIAAARVAGRDRPSRRSALPVEVSPGRS
jgi:hypothetical protein